MVVHATALRSKFAALWTVAGIGGVTVLLHHVAPLAFGREPINPGLPLAYLLDLCRIVLGYSLAALLAFLRPRTIVLAMAAHRAFRGEGLSLASLTAVPAWFRRPNPYSQPTCSE